MEDGEGEESTEWETETAAETEEDEHVGAKKAKIEAGNNPYLSRCELAGAGGDSLDSLSANYGDVQLSELKSKVTTGVSRTEIGDLSEALMDQSVVITGRAQTILAVGKDKAVVVVRDKSFTVQCVLTAPSKMVSFQMVKFVTGLSCESVVHVEGIVSTPTVPVAGVTQQVEVLVTKLFCISKSAPYLPFNVEAAAQPDFQAGEHLAHIDRNALLDLRMPAKQAIFHIKSHVENVFIQSLFSEGFVDSCNMVDDIHGDGPAVFKVAYSEKPVSLNLSPQVRNQIAICSDFERAFVIGPAVREDGPSFEFTSLNVEMEIMDSYFEVMDVVDRLFVKIFDGLNEICKKELDAMAKQYPFEPLKYLQEAPRLTFEEGVQMLKDAGVEIDHLKDLNIEAQRKLSQLVVERYGTEFYILHRYPLDVMPFYTMPCFDDPAYSNSFIVFIRGQEIISGAQHIHEPELLVERAEACGIDTKMISTYIDLFRYGTPPHGGFGATLERVVMLFCALDDIGHTLLSPRQIGP